MHYKPGLFTAVIYLGTQIRWNCENERINRNSSTTHWGMSLLAIYKWGTCGLHRSRLAIQHCGHLPQNDICQSHYTSTLRTFLYYIARGGWLRHAPPQLLLADDWSMITPRSVEKLVRLGTVCHGWSIVKSPFQLKTRSNGQKRRALFSEFLRNRIRTSGILLFFHPI